MAGYGCDGCDSRERAVLLVTPLAGGETLAVGADCMPVMMTQLLAGTVGIDADKLWAAVDRLQKRAQAEQVAIAKQLPDGAPGAAQGPPGGHQPGADGPTGDSSRDLAAAAAAAAGDTAGPGGDGS